MLIFKGHTYIFETQTSLSKCSSSYLLQPCK
jgi:hypothetical protein